MRVQSVPSAAHIFEKKGVGKRIRPDMIKFLGDEVDRLAKLNLKKLGLA